MTPEELRAIRERDADATSHYFVDLGPVYRSEAAEIARDRRALLADNEALRAHLDHAYERIDALANWAESHGCDVSYDRSLLAALEKTT